MTSSAERPRVRAAIDALPTYVPGKPAAAVEGAPSYKLSSNENPFSPLPGVFEAAVDAAATMNRYPDMGCVDLYAALAKRFGVPEEQLAAGTGSVAVLYQLLQTLVGEGDEVVYAWRSFEAYPIAVGTVGGTSVRVPVTADGRHDLEAMAAAVTDRTKMVLVCTPNNPTGPAVHAEELRRLLDAVPPRVLVVIDEAYREFIRDTDTVDGIEAARGRDNVCVLRTFSKAYGLAGLRVGFAVAPPPLAEALRKVTLPFGVSHIAQQAAIASLAAEDALLERVEQIVGERTRVLAALRGQGYEPPESEANFVWLPLGDATLDFATACQQQGVSVRPFAGDGARVSIGEPAANDLFLRVAGEFRGRET